MTNLIKFYKSLIFLILATVFLGFYSTAEAYNTWGTYRWRISAEESISNPIILASNLAKQTTWSKLKILENVSVDWNKSVLKNKIITNKKINTNCYPVFGRVEICASGYGQNYWLGLASVWFTDEGGIRYIDQATVKMNDYYFNQPTFNTAPWKRMTMCQEVGHVFGLDHQDENFNNENLGTCMDYTLDPDGTIHNQLDNQKPNQMDYDTLNYIYNPITDGCPVGFSKIDDYYFSQVDCWAQCGGNLPEGVLTHTKFAGFYPSATNYYPRDVRTWTYYEVEDDNKWMRSDLDNELGGCEFTCPIGETWNGSSCTDKMVSNEIVLSSDNYSALPTNLLSQNFINSNNSNKQKEVKAKPFLDMNDPKNWGKAVKKDAQGKGSVFIKDLGDNEFVMTYVIWANE